MRAGGSREPYALCAPEQEGVWLRVGCSLRSQSEERWKPSGTKKPGALQGWHQLCLRAPSRALSAFVNSALC